MSWVETIGLVPTDASANDYFGNSVAIYGDTAIVGAPLRDASGTNSGKAYIYTRTGSTWSPQGPGLVAPDASANDQFGSSVAIYWDTAIVGATGKDASGSNSGKAYIFTRTGTSWSPQGSGLVAPDASANDSFGISVGIYDNTVIIGAQGKDVSGTNSGKAYIFTRTGTSWSPQGPGLVPNDASGGDLFGVSVGIYNDTAIVGAYAKNTSDGSGSGKAYIFTRTFGSWLQQGPGLVAPDASANDVFGRSVAIYGDTAIVGAPFRDVSGKNSGKAYIFTRTSGSWSLQQGLTPPDANIDDNFGISVAIYGDTVIIGAFEKAYIYIRSNNFWSLQQKIVASDPELNANFGNSVGIYSDKSIVGALLKDASGEDSGKAYIFTFEQPGQLTLTEQTDICICSETLCANLSYTGVTEASKLTNVKDDKSIAISFNRQQEVNAVRNRSFASFDDYLRYKQASLKYY